MSWSVTFSEIGISFGDPMYGSLRLGAPEGPDRVRVLWGAPPIGLVPEVTMHFPVAGFGFNMPDDSRTYPDGSFLIRVTGFFADGSRVNQNLTAFFDVNGTVGVERTGSGLNDLMSGGSGGDTFIGGNGRDWLFGGLGNDLLLGGGGDDFLGGGGGDNGADTLNGGAGNDLIAGDEGDDLLLGGADADFMYAGAGNDTLYGGNDAGGDLLAGDAGDDLLFGEDGNDQMWGDNPGFSLPVTTGNDTMFGGAGNDDMDGGQGNDLMHGGADNDNLTGLDGNDTLLGEAGADFLFGYGGDDWLIGGAGFDRFNGGVGNDTLTSGPDGETDFFVYGVAGEGTDRIIGFEVGIDEVLIIFLADAAVGASRFVAAGTPLGDANPHLIYDQPTGRLWLDQNGSDPGQLSLLARFVGGPALSYSDFILAG
ncbi:calcium-binding protein [Falsiroseomonas oryzae]|uniref:calcium-binding protein n=1 Tax=Falsiroseomonas oryzae TaxID=2766473 RepID=UPI0022EA7FDB|nr:calcium-binding protein [Roseomonas sp. MO-31]